MFLNADFRPGPAMALPGLSRSTDDLFYSDPSLRRGDRRHALVLSPIPARPGRGTAIISARMNHVSPLQTCRNECSVLFHLQNQCRTANRLQ
jgi:hypothetical protein